MKNKINRKKNHEEKSDSVEKIISKMDKPNKTDSIKRKKIQVTIPRNVKGLFQGSGCHDKASR